MDFRLIAKSQCGLLVILGALLCIPGLYAAFHGSPFVYQFLILALACALGGIGLWFPLRHYQEEVSLRSAFVIVAVSWISACAVGSLPYYVSGVAGSLVNSWFESVSGFTGTGSTILLKIDRIDHSILLWRSLTQWIGGLGIIVFFIAVMPLLGLSIQQLFRVEGGNEREKLTPRVEETAKKLWILYVGYTAVLSILLFIFGMTPFDAVNHAFTTIATGGFSTHDLGIRHFQSRAIEAIIMIFMFIAAINFALQYKLFIRHDKTSVFSTELKTYILFLLLATALITVTVWEKNYTTLADSLWNSLFTSICIATTTGFTFDNFTAWGPAAQFIILMLMIFGGMSGSTAGGIKYLRVSVALKHAIREMRQAVHPNAVLTVKIDSHSVPPHVLSALWGAIILYILFFFVSTLMLSFFGLDLVSAASASISALSNIGPALGELHPYSNHLALPAESKLVLTAAMLAGRLEFYAILIPFTIAFWRNH